MGQHLITQHKEFMGRGDIYVWKDTSSGNWMASDFRRIGPQGVETHNHRLATDHEIRVSASLAPEMEAYLGKKPVTADSPIITRFRNDLQTGDTFVWECSQKGTWHASVYLGVWDDMFIGGAYRDATVRELAAAGVLPDEDFERIPDPEPEPEAPAGNTPEMKRNGLKALRDPEEDVTFVDIYGNTGRYYQLGVTVKVKAADGTVVEVTHMSGERGFVAGIYGGMGGMFDPDTKGVKRLRTLSRNTWLGPVSRIADAVLEARGEEMNPLRSNNTTDHPRYPHVLPPIYQPGTKFDRIVDFQLLCDSLHHGQFYVSAMGLFETHFSAPDAGPDEVDNALEDFRYA